MLNDIHIVHIVECAGGVERYLELLLPRLKRDGYRQTLICSDSYDGRRFKDLVDIVYTISLSQTFNPISVFQSASQIRHIVKRLNPNFVYCHSSFAGTIGRMAVRNLPAKVIYNPHGWAFNMRCSNMSSYIYKKIEQLLSRWTDEFVCISESEKNAAIENNIASSDKLNVIHNGVDINSLTEKIRNKKISRSTMKIDEDSFVVGMVGRIARQKSPDVFAKVAVKIKATIPNSFFVIVGDGPERLSIEDLFFKNRIDKYLYVTGWVDNAIDYISLFDVGVLFSRWEGFGYALVEYMVAGLPIVATKVDAIPELIQDERNGLLVDPDDVDQAYNAIMRVYNDETLRKTMSSIGALDVRSRFDVEQTVHKHEVLLKKMIED